MGYIALISFNRLIFYKDKPLGTDPSRLELLIGFTFRATILYKVLSILVIDYAERLIYNTYKEGISAEILASKGLSFIE